MREKEKRNFMDDDTHTCFARSTDGRVYGNDCGNLKPERFGSQKD